MCPTALLLKCILSQAALQVNPSFLCRIPELAGCLSSLRNLACGGLINFFRTHINRFKMFLLSQRIKVPPAISALHQKNSHSQCAKILPKALLPSSAFTNAGLQASWKTRTLSFPSMNSGFWIAPGLNCFLHVPLEPGELSEKTWRSHPRCRSNSGQLWTMAQPLQSRSIKPVIPAWTSAEHDLSLLSSLKSLPFPSQAAKSRCQMLLNCWCGFALRVPRVSGC